MRPHVRPIRSLIAALAGASCLILSSGCEDSAATQRDSVQAQIFQANLKLQKAIATGSGDDAAQSLNSVVTDLSRIEGGEAGQQAAKSVLAATALRELANVKLNAAESMEIGLAHQRSNVRAQAAGVIRMRDTAVALQGIDAAAERAELKAGLDAARAQVTQLRERAEELNVPVSELETVNANSQKEVEALRMTVTELRRKAQELGHADGFTSYEQAVQTGRQADKIEYEISQREIQLDYELTPELTSTGTLAEQLDSLIKSIGEADAQLQQFVKSTETQIAASQKQVQETQTALNAALESLNSKMTNELAALYDEAIAAAEKAVTQAQTAARSGRGDDMQSAKLATAQAQETLGRIHWSKSRGLADHEALLKWLSAAKVGNVTSDQLNALATTRQESHEAARAAYTGAQESLTQVQSQSSPRSIEAYNRSIDATIVALGGTPVARSSELEESAGTGDDTSPPTATDGPFATAEELKNYLSSITKDFQATRASLVHYHASTPEGQRMLKASTDMMNAMASIDAAMQAKFGQGLAQSLGPMGDALSPDLSRATIAEQTEDRVVYTITVMGQSDRFVLRNIGGEWKVDLDDMDPQKAMMLPMVEQMASAMSSAAPGLVSRIESGELKSAQEAVAAFGQVMMGGMGGMPGGGSAGGPGTPNK